MRSLLSLVVTASVPIMSPAPAAAADAALEPLRPPATPLVACDPYFSIWSCADKLTGDATRHWTGAKHSLSSLVRVDEAPYRLMGTDPEDVPPLPQTALTVFPTRTVYEFAGAGVRVALTLMTPMLPDDLEVLCRPVTYLTWEVASTDGGAHRVELYLDCAAEIAVNTPDQKVVWSRENVAGMTALRLASLDQQVLGKSGDDLRIDWGSLYAVALPGGRCTEAVLPGPEARRTFAGEGRIPAADDTRMPRAANDAEPVAAFALEVGAVTAKPRSRTVTLAYDDEYGIQYFHTDLRPFWRSNGATAADLLAAAARDYPGLVSRCEAFDADLMADLTEAGGPRYAGLCALAYRQALAGNKLVADPSGQPLLFPKECFSNGCIATVDVIYPMAPVFLLVSPTLMKAALAPILEYASSDRWQFPFAPHDLGTYPLANGQVYGGGEKTEENQMPVEESGNMLILVAALARCEGNAAFAEGHAAVLRRWAEYLLSKGLDPENQLCTDDFTGHLAHNVNLSAKAIVALGAYGELCEMMGDDRAAARYRSAAREFAAKWAEMADDGDHYRLAFDRPGTWSQKYNLVWDRILGLGLFDRSVKSKEMSHYRAVQNRYGLPLDNRSEFTKTDWVLWTATLTGHRSDFDALVDPVWAFLNDTPDRVPFTDWYWTNNARRQGFQARPVIGGVFLRMLYDLAGWRKWAGRDRWPVGTWAPIPAMS